MTERPPAGIIVTLTYTQLKGSGMASAEILKIGASKEVLESRLKTVLPKIHETFDGQVQVIEESDTDVLDAVMSGDLDACFTVRGEEDDAFNRWPLFFEDIMLIYPDSHIPVESQMDLDDVPFLVIPEKSVCKDWMLSWLSDAGQAPIGIEEAEDFLTIIRLVSEGAGFSAVPGSLFAGSLYKTEIQADPMEEPYRTMRIDLVARRGVREDEIRGLLGLFGK